MKAKHPDGIKETKTKQGYRWRAWKNGRSIAESGKDGYRNRKDMVKALFSLQGLVNSFITDEQLKDTPLP